MDFLTSKHKIILFYANLMVQGGGEVQPNQETNLKVATIAEPEISRNFRTTDGKVQGRWLAPTLNARVSNSGPL